MYKCENYIIQSLKQVCCFINCCKSKRKICKNQDKQNNITFSITVEIGMM